jgi:hypothetical protein
MIPLEILFYFYFVCYDHKVNDCLLVIKPQQQQKVSPKINLYNFHNE